ncbi:hypothetical protein N7481_003596 [Penicillium waksmanii]|uniref:uncharacterized protein n=1 Tax=Penicillium waksmanii TaxID=69791 RepID=UPI00254674EE|nr:uncharacterized protein N7481_003596 [Penicillium waksmanii]KAJ5988386.1 hypothetical protein N7481_003596 [Penicillium waksmanii]
MRFLSIALVGLASISVTAASDFETWDDIVGDVPQCIKTCLDDFYNDSGLEDKCGSSDDASMDCLCSVTSFSSVQSSVDDLSTCIQDGCDSGDLSEISSKLSNFQERFSDAGDQCMSEDSTSDDDSDSESDTDSDDNKNAANTLIPGFNALLASSAVLLFGVALY